MEIKKYATVKDMPKLYPFLTEAKCRHMIYNNQDNIHSCIIKIGARLLFDIEKFQDWLNTKQLGAGNELHTQNS